MSDDHFASGEDAEEDEAVHASASDAAVRERVHAVGPAGHPDALRLVTLECAAAAYGRYTWPSAPVLASWVWARRAALSDAHVLELGAGTALAGLTAAAAGARRVLLTDRADALQVLANAAAAAARNDLGANCSVVGVTWGVFSPALLALPPQKIILGADVLYDSAEFEPLLATVAFLLRRGAADAVFATAYQHRSRHASLAWRLAKWGLSCRNVTSAEELLPPGVPPPREAVEVAELVLARLWTGVGRPTRALQPRAMQMPLAARQPAHTTKGHARVAARHHAPRALPRRCCAPRAHAAGAPGGGNVPQRGGSELRAVALEAAPLAQAAAWAPEPWPTVGLPVEEACVPPPSWYTDPRFAALEEERVFKRNWQYAGPLSKLKEPGDYFTGTMFGLGFLVCMDEKRQVKAYHNVCSHRAMAVATGDGRAPLCEGGGVAGLRFECPYHGWQFDMDGRFRGCKVANGLAGIRNFTPETSSLWPIRCETWGPLVFLHMGDNADLPSVAEVMGAGGELLAAEGVKDDDWQFYKRVEYPMACNWKCMVDNYEDGNYHVYLAHSHLINCFYMDGSHNDLFDNMTSMWGPNVPKPEWPPSGLPGAEGYNIMESRTRGGVDQSYSMLYPNLFWNRYGCWHSVTNVTPTGVNSCLTTFDLFFKPATLQDTEFVARCVAAEDHLQKEDIDLCLRVSENLSNPRYQAGRYAPIEAPMWFFHQKLHKSIFGTSPGLKHRPGGSNRNYYKAE